MENSQICPSCGTENSFYEQNCVKCGNVLRNRVVNIDLWKTLWELIETPKQAFSNIIYSEHKNFISIILLLAGIKFFLNSYTLKNLIYGFGDYNIFLNLLIEIGAFIIFLIIISTTLFFTLKSAKIKARFKDLLAVYSYSFIPMIIGLMILFPLEYALFGAYFFTYDPSPFFVKPTPSYILIFLEALIYLWTLGLFIFGSIVLTGKKSFSIIIGISIFLLLGLFQIFIPFF